VDIVTPRIYLDRERLHYCVVRNQSGERDFASIRKLVANFLPNLSLPQLYHVDGVSLVLRCFFLAPDLLFFFPILDVFN
jgi:hypothetical protein